MIYNLEKHVKVPLQVSYFSELNIKKKEGSDWKTFLTKNTRCSNMYEMQINNRYIWEYKST